MGRPMLDLTLPSRPRHVWNDPWMFFHKPASINGPRRRICGTLIGYQNKNTASSQFLVSSGNSANDPPLACWWEPKSSPPETNADDLGSTYLCSLPEHRSARDFHVIFGKEQTWSELEGEGPRVCIPDEDRMAVLIA
jgi:hypothetical protein